MKFEYSFIAVTASDGDCYLSNFRPRQCGLFIVILSSTLSLKTVVFFYLLFVFTVTLSPSEIQSPCVVHECTSLCSLFQTALCSLFPPQAAVARLPQVPSYSLLQFVITVTASDGDCYLSNFRPRQCGLFIVILSSTLSLKTVHGVLEIKKVLCKTVGMIDFVGYNQD